MKFRAIINEPQNMREFSNIISTLAHMHDSLIMNIHQDKAIFSISCEDFYETPIFWCEVSAAAYFAEYTMEGKQLGDRNEIYLRFSGAKMVAALSKQSTNHIKIKLSDTVQPCLLVELSILATSDDNNDHIIAHQVPVENVQRRDWKRLSLPTDLDYKVTLRLPEFTSLKTLIESYKVLSPTIKILLTPNGECCLMTEEIEHTTTSTYRNLEKVPSSGKSMDSEGTVMIESRRIANILAGNQFPDANIFLSIFNNVMLRIRFEVRDAIVINCLLPGTMDSYDDVDEANVE